MTHVRTKLEVGSSGTDVGIVRVVEMSVEDLLGEGERTVETATNGEIPWSVTSESGTI